MGESSRPEEDEVPEILLRLCRRPFFPEGILPQLLCRHDLLPALGNLARVLQHTSKPVRRSKNLIVVHYSAFLVNRQRLTQEHFRLCVLVQSVQVEGELVETVSCRVMEVALCAGEYGQRLSVRCVRLVEHRFCFLMLMVCQENLCTVDLYIPQAVQGESGAMGCGVVSIHCDRLERHFGLIELILGRKAVGHVREIDGRCQVCHTSMYFRYFASAPAYLRKPWRPFAKPPYSRAFRTLGRCKRPDESASWL